MGPLLLYKTVCFVKLLCINITPEQDFYSSEPFHHLTINIVAATDADDHHNIHVYSSVEVTAQKYKQTRGKEP